MAIARTLRICALTATALIAFIPQHAAMTAGVNNDALAELIVAGTLWALVVYLRGERDRPWHIGLLLAAALLTKGSIYVIGPVLAVIAVIRTMLSYFLAKDIADFTRLQDSGQIPASKLVQS